MIEFKVNNIGYKLEDINPNTTVLDFMRHNLGIMDAKEGCASGDCGACTVMVHKGHSQNQNSSFYTINACITLLSLMHNQQLFTSSYLAENPTNHPEQAVLHPAQQAMVACHGSQCGFCTPGFVMSLATLYQNRKSKNQLRLTENLYKEASNKDRIHGSDISEDEVISAISGNLCRCTGYRPIVEAGKEMFRFEDTANVVDSLSVNELPTGLNRVQTVQTGDEIDKSSNVTDDEAPPALAKNDAKLYIPRSRPTLEKLLVSYPNAVLWAGGTDLGLTITQRFIDHKTIIQLSDVDELKQWSCQNDTLVLGAGMTYSQLQPVLEEYIPQFAKIIKRIASPQIRNMGTIGGNIANASPIGDLPPILLALDAKIHIRHCASDPSNSNTNEDTSIKDTPLDQIMALEDFFISYKQTKLRAGSYILAVHIPLLKDHQQLTVHKISKRYEDDISACLLALRIDLNQSADKIVDARIGLGGMAEIPLLAKASQQKLVDSSISIDSFKACSEALAKGVNPLSDVRASREYRMKVIQRLIVQSGKQLLASA